MGGIRQVPEGEDGRTAIFVTAPGGRLAEIADTLERRILDVALQDARRAERLCADDDVTRAELRMAQRFSAATVRRVVEIAGRCYGSREDDG